MSALPCVVPWAVPDRAAQRVRHAGFERGYANFKRRPPQSKSGPIDPSVWLRKPRPEDMPPPPPHPAPRVPMRRAEDADMPPAARRWVANAIALGWTVVPTYAVGHSVDARGRTAHLSESVVLRMSGPDPRWRAVAGWERRPEAEKPSWSLDFIYVWGPGEMPRPAKMTDGRRDKTQGKAPETLGSFLAQVAATQDMEAVAA